MMSYVFQITIFVAGVVIGLVGWYFKRNEDRLDENDKKLESKIDKVNKDLSDYKLEASKEFVSKDEFIRSQSRVDNKLDKIYEEILRQKEKRNAND